MTRKFEVLRRKMSPEAQRSSQMRAALMAFVDAMAHQTLDADGECEHHEDPALCDACVYQRDIKLAAALNLAVQALAEPQVTCQECGHVPHVSPCQVLVGAGPHEAPCGCTGESR
jgi:hypothetical protein